MISRYYIDCELYRPTVVADSMGVETLQYTKNSDIKGVIKQNTDRKFIEGVWKYVNTPIFITSNTDILKNDRIIYKGLAYDVDGDPINIMERNHHYEIDLKVVV